MSTEVTSTTKTSTSLVLPDGRSANGLLEEYYASRLPTTRRTVVLYQPVPVPLASRMDVDLAHAILSGADLGDTRDYFTLCEDILMMDNHIQGESGKRKLALLGDPLQILPEDDNNAADVRAAEVIKAAVKRLPSFYDACAALLDSFLWPVSLQEKVYKRSWLPGLAYDWAQLVRVPYQLLDYGTGRLRLRDVDQDGQVLGTTQAVDPMRYIVHRGHLLSAPDQRGGPMRSLVFWWLFCAMDRDWWARFLDRYGAPFPVGKFDSGDDYSRVILQNAFQTAARIGGIVVSRETEVQLMEAASRSAGEGFELFHRICRQEMSQLIIGQASSHHQKSGGFNAGEETKDERVRGDLRQFDGMKLANTLKFELFDPFLRLNRIPGSCKPHWGAEQPDDTEKTSATINNMSSAGLELTDEGIKAASERLGLPFQRKPAPEPPAPGKMESPLPGKNGKRVLPLSAPVPALVDRATQIDAANSQIARGGAAAVSRALGDGLSPLQLLVLASDSAEDLERRLHLFHIDAAAHCLQPAIEESLTAFTAQGVATTAR